MIPPDAMSSTKEITISKYKAEDYFDGDVSRYVVIGCAPEGETFSKPVEIYFTAPADLHTGDIGGVAGLKPWRFHTTTRETVLIVGPLACIWHVKP